VQFSTAKAKSHLSDAGLLSPDLTMDQKLQVLGNLSLKRARSKLISWTRQILDARR
jgi:hypothetical protein